MLVCFGAALALGLLFVERCTWHRSPMIDLALMRIRSLAAANAITLVAAAGFYSYVLCNVLFLTTVWGYSVLEAGLAITPGPFIAAAVARPASKLATRVGASFVIAAGALIWAAGVFYLARRVGTQPDFLGEWLPGMVILGIGAGITFPVVGSASVAEITGGRFATATGINSIARQLGAVLGVALLVAIVGTPAPDEVAQAFDHGWTFAGVCFVVTAVGALAIGRIIPSAEEHVEVAEDGRASANGAGALEKLARAKAASAPLPPPPRQKRTPSEFLRQVPMFAGLPQDTLDRIAERATSERVEAGKWLFRQGDPADGVYVVVFGRVDVLREEDGEQELLRVLGPESVVGELALLADSERSASIRARRDSELLKLTRDEFDALVAEDTRFTGELVRLMGVQLQKSRALEPPGPSAASVIAVVPGHEGLPVEQVAEALVHELSRTGPVVRLDRPSALPFESATEAEMLERYEQENDHVVLVAAEDGDWGDFCRRHADRVLLLAGERPPSPALAANDSYRECDLMFLSGEGEESHIGAWMAALAPRARHPLGSGPELGPSAAMAARRLAGRSVGLVLSGGGARSFAHIGVLDELIAAGFVIDRIGGVSMGAFIGAMLALGMDVDEIDARCYEEWVRRNPLSDYTLPRHSLIRGERVTAMLVRNLPGDIERMPRDYFCTTGDLPTAELVVHRRGPLYVAVGASMSLPGLVAPAVLGDRMLVDGGVLNNLPVDVMGATGEGPVIAVDVTNRFEPPAEVDGTANGRPRRFRRGARTPAGGRPLPGLAETLTRALTLGSVDTAEIARTHAQLVITPQNNGVGMLEFHQLDRMRAEGRRAAREALDLLDAQGGLHPSLGVIEERTEEPVAPGGEHDRGV